MSSFSAGLRPMNTCIMCGSAATAVLPSVELSVGMSRQPSRVWLSPEMILASAALTASRSAGFFGMNNMPTPY